jgi:glycosyltransferase involved in cell wall biosynthesis
MIYVCIPSRNEAPTVGLLLWKIRQVFAAFPREYQLLVLDDGSTDCTAEVLEPYARVLPLTVIRRASPEGYAASVEELLRKAVELTDRP